MADLRGGSTVGGRPIATSDMIEKLISQEQIQDWTNKMNKFESAAIATTTELDNVFKDKNKNGIHQLNNVIPSTDIHPFGGVFSANSSNYGFQIYSPEKDTSSTTNSAMYFRTRNGDTLRSWERIATYSYVDSRINTRFATTGGTISGATTINALLTINDLTVSNGLLTAIKNGNTVNIGSQNANFCHFTNSANIPFHFNRDVKVAGEIFAGATFDKKVWHEGNLTPGNYLNKSTLLSSGYDLNSLTAEGFYRVENAVNKPSKINRWAYVEMIVHDASYSLQKIYNYEGNLSYMRTKHSGTWNEWVPLGGGMNSIKQVNATTDWTLDSTNNLYWILVTHDLKTENIVSVVLTDTAKMSMLTGFEVIDINKTKVWCGENPTGKIVINAIP